MESNWKQHEKNSTHQQPTDEFSAFFGSNTGEQSRPSFHESALRLNTVPKPNRLWERIMLGSNCLLLLRMTSLISLKWSIAWWCLVYEKQPRISESSVRQVGCANPTMFESFVSLWLPLCYANLKLELLQFNWRPGSKDALSDTCPQDCRWHQKMYATNQMWQSRPCESHNGETQAPQRLLGED